MKKIYGRIPLGAITFIVIILMVVFAIFYTKPATTKIYTNKDVGISFSYTPEYKLEELPSPEKAAIVKLSTQDNANILLVFLKKGTEEVTNDKKFYDSILFNNPNQTANSIIHIGQFEGFRADIGPDQLRHTVYGTINDTTGLIIRSETNASSSQVLYRSEDSLKAIIKSITFQ